jgi:two-component system OmpR family response regulator
VAGTRILVVDDEPNICELLAATLRLTGYEVRLAYSGAEALRVAAEYDPDLAMLDVMLPDLGGFQVAQRLRAEGRPVPVLFMTARDVPADRTAGLTVGGDDYVNKPFSLEDIVLRVGAMLRRSRPAGNANGTAGNPVAGTAAAGDRAAGNAAGGNAAGGNGAVLRYADLELDDDAHEVRRAGRPIELSPTEFNLLRYLLTNAGRVVSKAQILDRVWSYDFGGDSRIVESYVYYLRRKLDRAGPTLIHTVRGVGYALRMPPTGRP